MSIVLVRRGIVDADFFFGLLFTLGVKQINAKPYIYIHIYIRVLLLLLLPLLVFVVVIIVDVVFIDDSHIIWSPLKSSPWSQTTHMSC